MREYAPRSKPPHRSHVPPTGESRPGGALHGVPVLVIEDDPASARLVSTILSNEGGIVRTAGSAEEGLALLRTFIPRILVVDLVLPRMSGLLTVRQLKAKPSTRDIPVIAVSALNGPETERLALEAGCAAYLAKPIDYEGFVDLLVRLLNGGKRA